MKNKKVLIITYYWPPSGGSGVQRWLRFVKYLSRQGWEPYVYTPENPSFTIHDDSLEKDIPSDIQIVKLPIWEPYRLFFKFQRLFGKKKLKQSDFITTGKKNFFRSVSSLIRGNFFIPDARVFWVNPSVKFLNDFVQSNQINRIVTTGPPHSMHLIGLKLKRKIPSIFWVADFRDPWSEWDLLDTLSLTRLVRSKHRRLEKEVLTKADHVITIAPYHVKRLEFLGNRKVELITNGFDPEDFENFNRQKTNKFTIRHIGVVDELRDPKPVMMVIKKICNQKSELVKEIYIEFIGNVNTSFRNFVKQDEILSQITSFVDQIPHDQISTKYEQTDLQLLVLAHTMIAPGNLPGKLFEYLASGNPILGIGPMDGDAALVLEETKAGKILERNDEVGIENALFNYFRDWKDLVKNSQRDVSKYSGEHLTQQLIDVLRLS